MRVLSCAFFICGVIAVASPLQTPYTAKETHVPHSSESRYHSHRDYPPQNHPHPHPHPHSHSHTHPHPHSPNYDRPVPPDYKLPHFTDLDWPHHDGYNRRTLFHDFPYDRHRATTTPFPTFYELMTSLFAGGGVDQPRQYDRHRPTAPPYPFESPPYSFGPTEPNYIPPPKPIRASVIKLESITRSPLYSSFEAETTTKYFHNVGTLLNHVLIENSKSLQNAGFHREEPVEEDKIPPFKPLPVLPTPGYTPPAVTPSRPPPHHFNKTDYKYPDSVQDQLPHYNFGEPRIPYLPEKPIPQIFATLPTETTPKDPSDYTRPPDIGDPTNILGLIDIRSLNLSGTTPPRFDLDGTKPKSFPGAVEKVNRPAIGFKKKVSTHPDKTSVERVTNLTVLGLSKIGEEKLSPHKGVNYLKVKDLIGREMSKGQDNSSKGLVNLNDELSLDAKILKDTNWDGFNPQQAAETSATTPASKSTKNKPAFWEVVEPDNATIPVTESTTPTLVFTTERVTTTESWFVTTDPSTTTEETTTARGQRRPGSHFEAEPKAVTSAERQIIITERPGKRRYSRRPKTVNFTPYPTSEEVQRRLASRSHFPKRPKPPNITLAFGNKSVLKSGQQSFVKEEAMKFSDEEVRKRRKIGKRRQLYERTRASTSERSVRDDTL